MDGEPGIRSETDASQQAEQQEVYMYHSNSRTLLKSFDLFSRYGGGGFGGRDYRQSRGGGGGGGGGYHHHHYGGGGGGGANDWWN